MYTVHILYYFLSLLLHDILCTVLAIDYCIIVPDTNQSFNTVVDQKSLKIFGILESSSLLVVKQQGPP